MGISALSIGVFCQCSRTMHCWNGTYARPVQQGNIDLNLLVPLKALLHERNVTRAAERIHLSQSAMSRTLERLRSELGDELLVRVGRNYELTPRGAALFEELGQGDASPRPALGRRALLASAKRGAHPLGNDGLCEQCRSTSACEILAQLAPGITLEVVPWHERVHEDNGLAGATHLILSPLAVPATHRVELLFEDVFLCVLGRKLSRGKGTLKMKEYLSFRHISIETPPSQQPLMDCLLGESRPAASSGCPRPCCDPHARNDRPGADYARSNSRARSSPT